MSKIASKLIDLSNLFDAHPYKCVVHELTWVVKKLE